MLKYAFKTIDFERVEIKTDVLNLPARNALLRIGAKEEGVLRSHTLMTHGRRRDTIYYSILKSEWSEIKKRNSWM
jgi:RimJ/RimL family protein N-acetyltransferase